MNSGLTDKRIAVLMGGASSEREISMRSGKAVFKALQELGYNAMGIDISTGDIQSSELSNSKSHIIACHPATLCNLLKDKMVEVALIALHGGYGENGGIQGLLEVMGISYAGSSILASALAMDKETSKKVFIYHGIPVPQFAIITSSDLTTHNPELAGFEMPWVIKPATEGSSIGISIVKDKPSAMEAIKNALTFGQRVLIEKHISGKEIHVGILNNTVLGSVEVRPKLEFYSYEAKYTEGLTEYILPPDIQTEILEKAENTALSAHKALGCKGVTRVDLLVDSQNNPFVLEVNTIPGMTETSLIPKIARHTGMDFKRLVQEILRDAIAHGIGQ